MDGSLRELPTRCLNYRRGCGAACTARFLILWVMATMSPAVLAEDGAIKSQQEPLALLFGQPVHKADLQSKRPQALEAKILGELRSRFAEENKITVTNEDVEQYLSHVFSDSAASQVELEARQQVAKTVIRNWKIDQQLYKQYGGEVIFQQANPTEPVGAYRRFLRHHEKKGSFKILNPDLRSAFWGHFERDYADTLDESKAKRAFETPWWLRLNSDEEQR